MPTTEYFNSPNADTAFVVQDDGTKNRVVLTAAQDISTLELPSNPNSTKGYVTIDGKKHKVVLTADIGGNGGGIDENTIIVKSDTIPTAGADNVGQMYIYAGETDATYTHGYIYECVGTPIYDSTVEFNPASISGTTAACSGSDFAALVTTWGSGAIDTIIKGTLTYDQSGELLVFVGQDDTDTTVCTFQLYEQDYEDAGFTFTGTFQDGDVITFSCTIEESGATYAWNRINVQPEPTPEQIGAVTQTHTTISLAVADWSGNTQIKTVTGVTPTNTVIVAPDASSSSDYSTAGILCTAQSINSLTFTCDAVPSNAISVNVLILN